MNWSKRCALMVAAWCWVVGVRAEVIPIDSAELARLEAQGVPVVDVRTEREWKSDGVIAGSRFVTYFDESGRVDPAQWLAQLQAKIGSSPDQPVVLVCRSGRRSQVAARFLSERAGVKRVYNLADGLNGWSAAGRPLVPYPASGPAPHSAP